MRPDDVERAEQVTAAAFAPSSRSGVTERSPAQRERWTRRLHHLLDVDPGGCWVADDGRATVGVAAAARRDLLWILSTYAVDPAYQGRGAGAALMDAALGYGDGCLRGLICSTSDPRAVRRYRLPGFTLPPTMQLTGAIDRRAIPIVDGVREGTSADFDLVDSIDRRVRGATHRPDQRLLADSGALLVCDMFTGSGYVFIDDSRVVLLAASSRTVAQRLLWAGLARMGAGAEVSVRTLTSGQEWAIDVGLAAGMQVEQDAYLALRHMRPPAYYVPSVAFG
jgi:GNAT superfamily N-acetyltransferase